MLWKTKQFGPASCKVTFLSSSPITPATQSFHYAAPALAPKPLIGTGLAARHPRCVLDAFAGASPPQVRRVKSPIVASDTLLFTTPEHIISTEPHWLNRIVRGWRAWT